MVASDDCLEYVVDQPAVCGGVKARRMFGDAGLYRDGLMSGLVADNVAYLKADSNRDRFLKAGAPTCMHPGSSPELFVQRFQVRR